MYIAYDLKHGIEYAKICTSKRSGKTTSKDYVNLGRVLDKEKGIYRNRERGVSLTGFQTIHTENRMTPLSLFPETGSSRKNLYLILAMRFSLKILLPNRG